MSLDGEHIRRLQGVDLLADPRLAAPGEDHVDLKNVLYMGFDTADMLHGAAERAFLRKAQDRVVFRHRYHILSCIV